MKDQSDKGLDRFRVQDHGVLRCRVSLRLVVDTFSRNMVQKLDFMAVFRSTR